MMHIISDINPGLKWQNYNLVDKEQIVATLNNR